MTRLNCLARGWYEWNEGQQVRNAAGHEVKQPYFNSCPSSELIAFAALRSVWTRPDAEGERREPIISCALLSRAAAPAIANIHPRMPVVLSPDHYATWLDATTPAPEVERMITQARDDFSAYPVSTQVGDVRHDLLARVDTASED